jgi:Pyruvate/2-oxoacid:ferredoxin oxidoreductase delta subunit
MTTLEGSEFDIDCDLIVSAIGQGGNLEGMEDLGNDWGLITPDKFYQIPDKPGYFVIGDIIKPHLLTTAIGHAAIACDSIDHYLHNDTMDKRPKVDVRHFDLLTKLSEANLKPDEYPHEELWGTDSSNYAIHNYDDRSKHEIISSDELFLGHFEFSPRHRRKDIEITSDNVLSHFEERLLALEEEDVIKEADRCMSCGMCFECDNCVIYCPQDAVKRTPKSEATMGRYVYTDYSRCVGCHICAEVCPTGYIEMGMGG